MLDYLIQGGTVVDGTGAPAASPTSASATDASSRSATRSTSRPPRRSTPTGLVVAPGFVDPHTHYDAQLFWDPVRLAVEPARRHDGHRRQLRLHARAARPSRRRLPAPHDGEGRGHAAGGARERRAVELVDLRRLPRRSRRQPRRQRRFPRRPLRAAPQRDGRGRGRQRGHARAARRRWCALLHESIEAGGLGFSTTLGVHPLRRRRRAGAVALGDERRGARAGSGRDASTRARRSSTSPTAASTASATTRSTS